MAISASDIQFRGSASMPDDDVTTNIGGAIDTTVMVVFADIAATDQVDIVSDSAGDTTQTVTIYGRDATGALISEAETLTGVTPVTTTADFERITKITLSASAAGSVTVSDDGTSTEIVVIPTGVTEVRRLFYDASADVSGGSARDYYDKLFIKNAHGTLTALSAAVSEQADPSTYVTFALDTAVDGNSTNGSGNDRQTVGDWSGLTFDSADKDVPGDELAAGEAIGVIAKLSLAAGTAAANTSWTVRLSLQTVD